MVLNLGSSRGKKAAAPTSDDPVELEQQPAPSEAAAEVTETPEPPKRARRTSTRTRRKPAETETPAAEAEGSPAAEAPTAEAPPEAAPEAPAEEPAAEAEAPAEAETAPVAEDSAEATSESGDDADAAEDRPRRSRSRRGRRGGAGRSEEGRASGDEDAPRESSDESQASSAAPELRPILRALEQQARQVDRLARVTEDLAGRVDRPRSGGAAGVAAPAARVGVFVDTANIELATDRLRVRFDWGKIMKLLLHDRQLVRAVAYSPIHDDPAVSIETQRFVEPFLDKGFKIVTKPFRRFQDGSIKANLDIELALDVVAMLDRLDVVILVSGDGDFQRLVEMAQGKGVRVEVASVGMSTASNLRHAADEFIDLGGRVREIRV